MKDSNSDSMDDIANSNKKKEGIFFPGKKNYAVMSR